MKKHVLKKKLVLNRETLFSPSARELSEVAGGSVRLSCDGQRCSNDSSCYPQDTNPLCAVDTQTGCQ
ncbi:MAG TPA: class I lanthipeptide [Thermoanaerobaculia bacterium]|nr:class I lanthipeptide [Thermoanaerobaculia bacterium]